MAWVIFTGLTHFKPPLAFDFPAGAFEPGPPTAIGLGVALAIAMYDFLGYYQICYLGTRSPTPQDDPRSILISVMGVALIYLVMNVSILGVLPWRRWSSRSTSPPT